MLGFFFWELRGSLQRRVRHMPALQLAGIRQFIGGTFSFSCTKGGLAENNGKQSSF
jgi:hypothetical protein